MTLTNPDAERNAKPKRLGANGKVRRKNYCTPSAVNRYRHCEPASEKAKVLARNDKCDKTFTIQRNDKYGND